MTLSATYMGGHANSTTATLAITIAATGGAGRLILIVNTENNTSTAATVSSVTGIGTWASRARSAHTGSPGQATEEWYLDVGSSSSGTITVNMSGTIDDAVIQVVFISSSTGAVISFDTNASLPAKFVDTAGVGTASVSTDSGAPYLLLITGNPNNVAPSGPTPVSTLLGQLNNTGGTHSQISTVVGGSPGTLSSTSAGWGTVSSGVTTLIVDALTEPAVPGSMFAVMGP